MHDVKMKLTGDVFSMLTEKSDAVADDGVSAKTGLIHFVDYLFVDHLS